MDLELAKKLMKDDDKRCLDGIADLFANRSKDVYKKYIPTGFKVLDETIGGGLTSGVYYIGAMSALGKSTFCLQMADQMAEKGQPVVYVSLEMTKVDLVAKLISMHTMKMFAPQYLDGRLDFKHREVVEHAKTANMLTSEAEAAKFTAADWKTVTTAAETVKEHGKNIRILESMTGPISVDDIENYIEANALMGNPAPVLIVDYLQLLAFPDVNKSFTDKQIVDYTVNKFRYLARTYNMPVVVISSFNRSSYKEPVEMESFKESGNIEYSADGLLGFQFDGVEDQAAFDINVARSEYPREIELVVLKQRYGPSGAKIKYNFSTTYNYFDEVGLAAAPVPKKPAKTR